MRSIRKLYFQNEQGMRYPLNGEKGVYASMLAGFGYSLSPAYADLSRGFFVPVADEAEPQGTISFTLTFTIMPYEAYNTFVTWLSMAKAITLVYDPMDAQEFYRDVSVSFLQKGELNAVEWLEVPCSLLCVTPWYQPSPTVLRLDAAGVDESRRYDYVYSDSLIYGTDSTAALSGSILSTGHVPGALNLAFHGEITNPRIRLTGDYSGKTYGICSVITALGATDTLKLSTKYENSYIKKISAAGVETDLLDALDLTTGPFFRIPVYERCTITIEADAAFTGTAELTIYNYFRSV